MRYYFPYAHKAKSGYVNCTSSVYNYPIQALATAEIIPIALVYFWHRVRAAGLRHFIRVVNTVHDSIICELHPDYVEQFKELALQSFTRDVYEYLRVVYDMEFDVPLGTGITTGSHWSIGDEESYNVDSKGNVERVQ
jgi:DNA polymerase I-like protein with 3'-5' exonuclease and polymerase domains